jgi:hypothetical protein
LADRGALRKAITWAFAAATAVAAMVFQQAISAFATQRGWDRIFIDGWKVVSDLGWASSVAFTFFALAGATLALWTEYWLRDRQEAKAKLAQSALSCTARFTFTKSADGGLSVALSDQSDNVAYWAWYVNNGGTLRNEAVLMFVEFEREIALPEVFAHSADADGDWQHFASTDRFIFVELKGWPTGEVVLQAIASKALGLDRGLELKVWRKFAPIT